MDLRRQLYDIEIKMGSVVIDPSALAPLDPSVGKELLFA